MKDLRPWRLFLFSFFFLVRTMKFDVHLADFYVQLRRNYFFLSLIWNVWTVINGCWMAFSRALMRWKKKRKKLASFSSFLYIHTHITENKPETQDETYFVFKALTYIFPPSPPRSSPAQFTGSIFSLIKNSPSCSSKHFSQGCTITSQKFGGMKGGRINDLF